MSESERIANYLEIKYTAMSGNIGVISNSAGLSMATADLLAYLGGAAANFADFGGSGTHEQVASLIEMLSLNPQVKVLFINCNGGIFQGKQLIASLINRLQEEIITKPVVIRMLGTGVEDQDAHMIEQILAAWSNKVPIYVEYDFERACLKAVEIAEQETAR